MTRRKPSILILGTRGVPAAHGGFETFAEHIGLFLVGRGWDVGIYCQEEVASVTQRIRTDMWRGIERIHVQVASTGPRATLDFDWHCVRHAAKQSSVCLVLGYNGAMFLPYLKLHGRRVMTNMDGIEWRRAKWSRPVKAWFWVNEWVAAWTSDRLVADHPAIADHLATRRPRSATAMIPYGGRPVFSAPEDPVRDMGLEPGRYLVSVARIEPDNSILPVVEAFSRRTRDAKLVVVGTLDPANAYHRQIRAVASPEVLFPGAIYDPNLIQPLRFHARAYVHGHTVGGTNPSLVEALWAGNPVVAHDNVYNRWTAGDAGLFFADADTCAESMDTILNDEAVMQRCAVAARARAEEQFKWNGVLTAYEREALALIAEPKTVTVPSLRPTARGNA